LSPTNLYLVADRDRVIRVELRSAFAGKGAGKQIGAEDVTDHIGGIIEKLRCRRADIRNHGRRHGRQRLPHRHSRRCRGLILGIANTQNVGTGGKSPWSNSAKQQEQHKNE